MNIRNLVLIAMIIALYACGGGGGGGGGNGSGGPTLTSIEALPSQSVLHVGETIQLTAIGHYSDGSVKDITNSITWASSTPSVASVTNKGLVTLLSNGSTEVSASMAGISMSSTISSSRFTPALSISTGGAAHFVASGDFDRDGNLDVVAINDGRTNDVAVLLGRGDGTFQSSVNYSVGNAARALVIADVNKDSIPDINVAVFGSGIAILIGRGDGTFNPAYSHHPAMIANDIAASDLNGDGNIDLVTPNPSGGVIVIHIGNGAGSFTASNITAASNQMRIKIADFNGDSKQDLLTDGDSMSIYIGNGDGTFSSSQTIMNKPTINVSPTDFNRDGKMDIVAATRQCYVGLCGYFILNGDGAGNFSAPSQLIYPAWIWPHHFVVTDINGDGDSDIASSIPIPETYYGFQIGVRTGNESLEEEEQTLVQTYNAFDTLPEYEKNSILATDFNHDGKIDLVIGNWLSGVALYIQQ